MTRALIVDDEEDMRVLVRSVIDSANQGLEVVGEACNGAAAVVECRALRPDAVVLDQRMPEMSGTEAAAILLAEHPGLPIILFSAFLSDEVIAEAEEVGIHTCVSKDDLHTLPHTLWAIDA